MNYFLIELYQNFLTFLFSSILNQHKHHHLIDANNLIPSLTDFVFHYPDHGVYPYIDLKNSPIDDL